MKINYLISIFIILMLNKINAINCDSIDEHVQSLENSQITKLDNNSHLIIFFKANKDKKYYALIKEIPAYLSYIKCENNTIYFSNIRDNKFSYFSNLFQKSSIENTTINVINTNFTGYTDSLNKIYKLQSSIIEQNELRKYLQQGYDINLSEIPDTSDTSDTSNSNDSELMEGLLGDDSEMRKGLFDDDSEMRENFTNHYSLLDDNSPSTTDANSTIKPLKEIQWSQTEDALIPHDSSKFIEEYADHKYTNTNDLSTKFKLIKNVSSNDENLRFIKEKINELKHGEQIIIQILDQIDFKLDNILALKIKLNTPQHNEHTPYYDIDLFKYSRVIYSVKHVKIEVNIIHNSTEMSILHNDTSDHIKFDAANIYIANDITIQQPLNEGLKLHPTANPETSSRKRPATLISEQQPPLKKTKTGSEHNVEKTIISIHSQIDEDITHSSIPTNGSELNEHEISIEELSQYRNLFNPYYEHDYFDVKGFPIIYIDEFDPHKVEIKYMKTLLSILKVGQEILMKFFISKKSTKSNYFAVRIRLNNTNKGKRYYDVDFFKYKNLIGQDELDDSKIFIESYKNASIIFENRPNVIEIRLNKSTIGKPFTIRLHKVKIYIYDPSSSSANQKQIVPVGIENYVDLYNEKFKKIINEIHKVKKPKIDSTTENTQEDLLEKPNEKYLSVKSNLSQEVKDLITTRNIFKNEYYILEKITTIQELDSNQQNNIIDLDVRTKNLEIGESLVLIEKDFAIQPYKTTKQLPVFIITKIDNKSYNLIILKYDSENGFLEFRNYTGKLYIGYRYRFSKQRYLIKYEHTETIIEDYYVIGELSKKIQECSSVDKLAIHSQYDSMNNLLNSVFKDGKYVYDEKDIDNIENRKEYLKKIFSNSDNESFVFVDNKYLNNSDEIKLFKPKAIIGLILEPLNIDKHGNLGFFKIITIEKNRCFSNLYINDEYTGKLIFAIHAKKLVLRLMKDTKRSHFEKDLSNYKLIREKNPPV